MAADEPTANGKESWRRIRVGLTGLAGILLLIGLTSAMLERLSPRVPEPADVAGDAAVNAVDVPEDEPLAELGVAPGAADSSKDATPAAK